MRAGFLSRVRIFPLLIAVALAALSLRAFEIYTQIGLMGTAANAQAQEAPSDAAPTGGHQAEGDDAGEAKHQEAARTPIVVGLPDSEEMEIITQLRQRRIELDERSKQIELQAQLLSGTEKRIDDKILQLKDLEQQIKSHLRLFDERENEQLASIVKVYETMKPKDAAPRFEVLSIQTQLDLVTRMKPSKVAALMEKMTPAKASELTTELATRAQPPQMSDLQEGN